MAMIPLPGLTYQGHPCSYDDGVVPPVEPPVTQPPKPTEPGTTVYPPELQPKHKSQSAMPWTTGTRLSGPTITHDTAWIVNFRAGAASNRLVRLGAVEREGGPLHRIAILFRRSDGLVLQRIESSSITFNCLVGQPVTPYRVGLEANTNYAMGIFNKSEEQGAMFADLYL
jgi:hypothetical protein